MALVKTSNIAGSQTASAPGAPKQGARKRDRQALPGDKLTERLAAATEELASGLGEASAAAEELRRSMEQIATGAEQAAAASQEQLASIRSAAANLATTQAQADTSRRRTEALQTLLAEAAAQITTSVRAVERNADRQEASVEVIAELERRAADISDIISIVSRISDQTSLLALNAAIEAARAGEHGRGFAVVADEVRVLAEASDRSAQEIQALAGTIQSDIRGVVEAGRTAAERAIAEARAGAQVTETLNAMREDMTRMTQAAQDTQTAALHAEQASSEAQRGAEQVSSAAQQQASAASEAHQAVEQQAQSLDQAHLAAQTLAKLTQDLRAGGGEISAAEQIGTMAEELSATVQELSSAASEIMAAVEQINRGSQLQAAATQQTSAALAQIESSAKTAQQNAHLASERVQTLEAALGRGRQSIDRLVTGISDAVDATRSSLTTITEVEAIGRKIEKIVDSIALTAVQTTMLAVSGSVEAARAGSSGRGFAVVSKDIRGLAREASNSVERVKDTIRGVLDQVANLRRDLEQIAAAAETEAQNNRATFVVLEKVESDVAMVRAASEKIQQGADLILASTMEIAQASRQIAAAAEEASAASRQSATAANEQATGAEDLAAAIEEIASLADELKQQNG